MTENERLRQEVDAVKLGDPHWDLLRRLMTKIEGQAEAYKKLMENNYRKGEKLREAIRQRNLQTYKALALETLLVKLYAESDDEWSSNDYREWARAEMLPYMDAAGYDFGYHEKGGAE